jgi:hypothetical protein
MSGGSYRMPATLSAFQREIYVHLIDWKRNHITTEPGQYRGRAYDALLPDSLTGEVPHLYAPARQRFLDHQRRFPFKTHKFANHMASSQIACANLFLPLMDSPDDAARILAVVKPDLKSIAVEYLDRGFRIEFWDEIPEGPTDQKGMLGDHNRSTGTDSDFAIAYRNREDVLCLWLIEHKLTEAEFTMCGGARSKGRIPGKHACAPTAEIMAHPAVCYYHSACGYRYWDLTMSEPTEFPPERLIEYSKCPFAGGMNQLWRNQLLAIAIERAEQWPYREVYFSVVHHPRNQALAVSVEAFLDLTGRNERFSVFTPEPLVTEAKQGRSAALREWAEWYSDLYAIA